jgi:hypothetical protein
MVRIPKLDLSKFFEVYLSPSNKAASVHPSDIVERSALNKHVSGQQNQVVFGYPEIQRMSKAAEQGLQHKSTLR